LAIRCALTCKVILVLEQQLHIRGKCKYTRHHAVSLHGFRLQGASNAHVQALRQKAEQEGRQVVIVSAQVREFAGMSQQNMCLP
jgi:hypothetical protein